MQQKTIFYYTENGGLSSFETSAVKLLLEDDEFFEKHINHIDQNAFNFASFREIVGMLKDAWNQEGVHLSPDVLYMRAQRMTDNKMFLEEFKESLDACKNHPMNDYRRNEVDKEIEYWTMFTLFAYATNHAKDTLYGDRISSFAQLKKATSRLIEDVEKLKKCYEVLNEESNGGRNDWD